MIEIMLLWTAWRTFVHPGLCIPLHPVTAADNRANSNSANWKDGYNNGWSAGNSSGYNSGYSAGSSAGYSSGYNAGKSAATITLKYPSYFEAWSDGSGSAFHINLNLVKQDGVWNVVIQNAYGGRYNGTQYNYQGCTGSNSTSATTTLN